jgi:hypothetical protein
MNDPSQYSIMPRRRPDGSGEPLIFRGFLMSGLLLAAVLSIYLASEVGVGGPAGNFLMNLSTEVVGIGITLAIVERILERRSKWEESRRVAWRVLHDLDYAVWVWQGGRRALIIDELLGLLALASEDDLLPPFTETLLLRIGSEAKFICKHQADIVASSRHLANGLKELSKLSSIRDPEGAYERKQIKFYLQNATRDLARALDLTIEVAPADEIRRVRDITIQAQELRRFGRRRRVIPLSPAKDQDGR